MNLVDIDGNTALHLAVEAGSLQMFCPLLANPQVNLNLPNSRGETPLDIAEYKIPEDGFYHAWVIHTLILLSNKTDILLLLSFYLVCFCRTVKYKYVTHSELPVL
jgi:hypothetical protein